MLNRVWDYFFKKVWKKNLKNVSKPKLFYYKSIRFLWISTHNLFKHQIVLRASALTYFSLMAIVPFFAIILEIGKRIGYQDKIEAELVERFHDQKEIIDKVVLFSKNLMHHTEGGLIAIIGIIFLFWSMIRVISNLEISMNEIWNVEISRKLKRRIGNYLVLIFVIPILTVTFISLKIYILTLIPTKLLEQDFITIITKVLPYLLLLSLFTMIYIFIPFVKVKFKYALLSAIIASGLFQILQAIYVHFQVQLTKFNAVYGSFAALPLFLIWLQISWIILLYGAELSYASQNIHKMLLIKGKKIQQ